MKISVYSSVKHTCAHQITVLPMYLHRKIDYSSNADIYISVSMCTWVVPRFFFFLSDNMLALGVLSSSTHGSRENNRRAHARLVGHK